ncbi:MAG TPA: hypothetical protein VHK02_18405 [Actinomycetota bacterium]|jgi:hypothetical protein|nr:hypothetical protein [Actinomycetota bacterium]
MANSDDQDRPANRPWWVDALDPVENLRTLANVQDFGRLAAEELADRLLARGDGRPGGPGEGVADADLDELARRLQAEAARAGEAWASLVEVLAAMTGALAGRLAARDGAERPGGPAPLRLEAGPGAEATGVFYVHNTAPVPVASARPHCAPPRSHLGHELAAGAVRFDPELLEPLPARSSCGIEVRACVPPGTAPGTYVSVLLVSGVPELYLPLRVTVAAAEAEG